jgi:hypothetical protein
MANYTVNQQDVSTLHNGVLYLTNALEYAKDMLNPDSLIIRHLEQSVKYLKPIRDNLMNKQDQLWDEQNNYFTKIQQDNDFMSIWSIYTYDNFKFEDKHNLPVGAEFICWDVPEPDARFHLEGDTWLDLWKSVDRYLDYYSDYIGDHLFLEGFGVEQKNKKEYIKVTLGS